ncbi:MAG: molecular chaperone TorD family protein [Candidatus Marinimicrobia bacterium]|nr:molecular chaperone TorD family protein [Candidatus Neomarinimicrobiota bacterium]
MNSKLQTNQLNDQLVNRANIYKLLADCFKYPEDSLESTLKLLKSATVNYDDVMGTSAEKLVDNFKLNTFLKELQIEYSRLFVGPFQLDAPPYSSVYLDKQGLVMGESTQQAIEFYVKAGLDPALEIHEPPDHIRVELEFMYYLLFQKVMDGNNRFLDISYKFMETHLIHWVFTFTNKIKDCTESKFYIRLAELLDSFLSKEKELFLKYNKI